MYTCERQNEQARNTFCRYKIIPFSIPWKVFHPRFPLGAVKQKRKWVKFYFGKHDKFGWYLNYLCWCQGKNCKRQLLKTLCLLVGRSRYVKKTCVWIISQICLKKRNDLFLYFQPISRKMLSLGRWHVSLSFSLGRWHISLSNFHFSFCCWPWNCCSGLGFYLYSIQNQSSSIRFPIDA